jgi:hypothetical protein
MVFYLAIATILGDAAKEKGHSKSLYFSISIFFTPLIAGFMVHFLVMTEKRIFEKMVRQKELEADINDLEWEKQT